MALNTNLPIFVVTLITVSANFFPAFWLRNQEKVAIKTLANSHPELGFIKRNYDRIVFAFLMLTIFTGAFSDRFSPRTIDAYPLLVASLTIFNAYLGLRLNLYAAKVGFPFDLFVYDQRREFIWIAIYQIIIALLAITVTITVFWMYG